MTLTLTTETDQLRTIGAAFARAGNAKPDFATWTQTYGAGDEAVLAHRAFCHGFDGVRSDTWELTKRDLTRRARMRIAVPA
jgi:hypothetical protein